MMMVMMKAADDIILSLLDDCHPWVLNVKKADALMETIFKFCRHFSNKQFCAKTGRMTIRKYSSNCAVNFYLLSLIYLPFLSVGVSETMSS